MPFDRDDPPKATRTHRPRTFPAPRLRLAATLAGRRVLDGGWWPRSRDPAAELPGLIASVAAELGVITRVALNLTAWDADPCRIAIGDRIIAIGWFCAINGDTISLTRDHQRRITLLVVPPEATAESAAIALAAAADGEGGGDPAAILAASGITAGGITAGGSAAGGSAASVARHPSSGWPSGKPAWARTPKLP